jgi:predicted ABC-type ATPase
LLNPDDAAKVYYASNPGVTPAAADYWAANAIPAQVIQCIDAGENVAVETVLSSDKYEPIIAHAHKNRYEVGLIYLALASAKVSKARVANRLAGGGHPVPEDRIPARWQRSLDRLVKLAPSMDGLLLLLSTSAGPTLLAEKYQDQILWYGGTNFPQLKTWLQAKDARQSGPKTGGMPLPPRS